MDDFMRSLSDQQKAMFMKALQDSGTPPESEATGDEDDSVWTTTMPPHIKAEFEAQDNEPAPEPEFAMGTRKKRKTPVKSKGVNQFVDSGQECKSSEDSTPEFTPTERRRKPPEKITVTCSVCGSSMNADPRFVQGEYHRCEKCCGR